MYRIVFGFTDASNAFIKGDSVDGCGPHGGDAAHMFVPKWSGLRMRLEGREMSPHLHLMLAEGARQHLLPWSNTSCCGHNALLVKTERDGTMKHGVTLETCKAFPLFCFCLSLLT